MQVVNIDLMDSLTVPSTKSIPLSRISTQDSQAKITIIKQYEAELFGNNLKKGLIGCAAGVTAVAGTAALIGGYIYYKGIDFSLTSSLWGVTKVVLGGVTALSQKKFLLTAGVVVSGFIFQTAKNYATQSYAEIEKTTNARIDVLKGEMCVSEQAAYDNVEDRLQAEYDGLKDRELDSNTVASIKSLKGRIKKIKNNLNYVKNLFKEQYSLPEERSVQIFQKLKGAIAVIEDHRLPGSCLSRIFGF